MAVFLGGVVFLWLGPYHNGDRYRKAERIGLRIVLGLAIVLGAIGFMILTQQEPYNCCAGS